MASAGHARRPTSGAAWRGRRSRLLNASWRSIMTSSSLTTDIPDTLTLKHYAGKQALPSSVPFLRVMRCSDLHLCFVHYTRTALCRWSNIYSSCHFFFFFYAGCHLALLLIWTLILLSWAISDWTVRSWVCIQISLPRKLWPFVRAITFWATDLLLFQLFTPSFH